MSRIPLVLFLCPHGAAKSLMARELFLREARLRGLHVRAACAGTDPDPGPMPEVVERLARDGIDVSSHRPRRVEPAELGSAARVVSLGCDVDALLPPGVTVQLWSDVPLPSRDLEGAYRAIARRAQLLADGLVDAAG